VPGPAIMQLAANASHVALYGFMVFMPASGIAMGYYGGKGLPFFGYTIPGAPKPNGAIAKDAFKVRIDVGARTRITTCSLHRVETRRRRRCHQDLTELLQRCAAHV
jgi:cytochrome b561